MTQLDKDEIAVVRFALAMLKSSSFGATERMKKVFDELCERLDVEELA